VQQILLFILLGLGSGALIAGIALAVVLTYRGSGVINLSTGAIAMLGGYAFWALNAGKLATLVRQSEPDRLKTSNLPLWLFASDSRLPVLLLARKSGGIARAVVPCAILFVPGKVLLRRYRWPHIPGSTALRFFLNCDVKPRIVGRRDL